MLRAHAMFNQGRPPREYRPIAERALELSGTVSPVERSLIEGFVWRHRKWEADFAGAEHSVRAYETLLQLVPGHYWALLELQFLYSVLGRQSDAERVTLHAAAVRPHAFRFAIDSARIRLRHGDAAAARAIIQRLSSGEAAEPQGLAGIPPESLAWFRLWGAHDAWLNSDAGRALQEVQTVEQGWTSRHYLGLYALANVYQGLGRYQDAERVARRMQPPQTAFFLALIAARQERWDDLRRLLNPERPDFQLLNFRFHHLVRAGWLREAAWVLEERQRRNVLTVPNTQLEHEGHLLVAEGRFAEGMAKLEPLTLARAGPLFATDDAYAAALRAVGDLPGAIRHLEQIGEMRAHAVSHGAWQVTSWLDCRVRLAEYYVEAGRPSDAARVADEARRLLAVADADHPLRLRLERLPAVQLP
jgi:tetratricopeptide (TPR) repeat protein